MKKLNNIYTSCACNRTPKSVDWNSINKICYASCNGIAVYNLRKCGTLEQMLIGHTNRVNCVRWLQGQEEALVSGSCDNKCIVWKKQDDKLKIFKILTGHQGSVNSVDGVKVGSRMVIVSTSADSTVKIWQGQDDGGDLECTQTLSFGSGFALDVTLTVVPNTEALLLACGGDDNKVHVYLEQQPGKFTCVEKLCGHEDWVRGLQFTRSGDCVLLASCSQDCYIRIWRFAPRDLTAKATSDDLRLKENTIQLQYRGATHCYAVTLESVLQGHDNWVYSVAWQPGVSQCSDDVDGRQTLLSASMDKTLIIWKPDKHTGLWIEHTRVGEVGGNTLGFYGGVFGPDGNAVMSHGYQGALEMYTLNENSHRWEPQPTFGGHFDGVHDIAWQPETGHFLLSLSSDQTTRCHGYWKASDDSKSGWYELARPQIHGYDLQTIAMIDRYRFASGADEKVVRVFEASKNFVENLSRICNLDLTKDVQSRSEGASVPALGLSNKAVDSVGSQGDSGNQDNRENVEHYFTPVHTDSPPSEVDLLQNTLWPEIHKLYGHGYEIFALSCNPQGTYLASACKAARADDATIMIWSCDTWRHLHTLKSHSLTVTQLAWSHSGQLLLSVSRDRTWTLFKSTGVDFERVAFTNKSNCVHSRIIWSCAWSHDDQYFITVSRDKKALVWRSVGDNTVQYEVCSSLTCPEPITAVDFAPTMVQNSYIVAFGFESGLIWLYSWCPSNPEPWKQLVTLDKSEAHHLTVKRLQFAPLNTKTLSKDGPHQLKLASCGADHCVRIYSSDISDLITSTKQ